MSKYHKDFRGWVKRKQYLNERVLSDDFYCKEREIWWAAIGVNIGAEIDGKNNLYERPVLIVRKVGRTQFYGLPLTSKEKDSPLFRHIMVNLEDGFVSLSYECLVLSDYYGKLQF